MCSFSSFRISPPRAQGAPASLPSFAADSRHVFAVTTHRLATLSSGDARFLGSELVSRALLMCGATTLRGDLTLLLGIHACEPPTLDLCHENILPSLTGSCGLIHVPRRGRASG